MRCTKLNFEDFYSARAFSTLQEAAKQRNGVLRDTDYSVPVFQGCVCTKHQPHGSLSSGRGGMASGSSTTPKTSLAGRCGVMAHGCVLGRQHLKIHPFCCFPALQGKKCSVKNRISLLLLAALQRPREVKQGPPLLYSEHTRRYRTALFHSVI